MPREATGASHHGAREGYHATTPNRPGMRFTAERCRACFSKLPRLSGLFFQSDRAIACEQSRFDPTATRVNRDGSGTQSNARAGVSRPQGYAAACLLNLLGVGVLGLAELDTGLGGELDRVRHSQPVKRSSVRALCHTQQAAGGMRHAAQGGDDNTDESGGGQAGGNGESHFHSDATADVAALRYCFFSPSGVCRKPRSSTLAVSCLTHACTTST